MTERKRRLKMKTLRFGRLFRGLSRPLAAGSITFALAALLLAASPKAALADDLPIQGVFSVNFTATPTAVPNVVSVLAHGIGNTSHTGDVFLTIQKTIDFKNGAMQGTFTMTAENGDTLAGNYSGVISPPDSKGFAPFSGQLTITGGSGQFGGAKGTASFNALANLLTGQAVYSVRPGSSGQ
jgi:hypothetical protein